MKRRMLLLSGLTALCLFLTLFSGGKAFAQSTQVTHTLAPQAPAFSSPWPDLSGCWDSRAFVWQPPAYDTIYDANGTPHQVLVALWASPDCGTNWADVQVVDKTSLVMDAQVCRKAGQDGSALCAGTDHGGVYSNRVWSKMLYSPNNYAQAIGWFYIGGGDIYPVPTGWH